MNAQTKSVIVIPQVSSVPMIIAADTVDILGALKAEIDGYEPDASTETGRKEIGSKAREIAAALTKEISDGTTRIYEQALMTPRGLAKLASLFSTARLVA